MPLVLSHFSRGENWPTISVPAGLVARISRAALAICQTCVLMRSTSAKSARMPSSMMRRSMFTMCAWRILRRFTTSVICMRVRSSFACAFTAKMLTSLVSISSSTARGMSVSGRGARSSSINALILQALPLQFARQRRRHLETGPVGDQRDFLLGLNAQAAHHGVVRAGAETPGRMACRSAGSSRGSLSGRRGIGRKEAVLGFLNHVIHHLSSNRWSHGRRAIAGRPRCRSPGSCGCRRSPRGCPVRPPRHPRTPGSRRSTAAPALRSVCRNRSACRPVRSARRATCSP